MEKARVSGEEGGRGFIAMECFEGQTLQEEIRGRRIARDEVLKWGMEIAEVVDAAHAKGIVHRDIKPANIFKSCVVTRARSWITEASISFWRG